MNAHCLIVVWGFFFLTGCGDVSDNPLTRPGSPFIEMAPPDVRLTDTFTSDAGEATLEIRAVDGSTRTHPCRLTHRWACAGEAWIGDHVTLRLDGQTVDVDHCPTNHALTLIFARSPTVSITVLACSITIVENGAH